MILSKSYHEIMEKIEVTDEMRTHIREYEKISVNKILL